ncbi:MAG: hypothetical protein KAW12_01765 [Candidatus Aminicenantes bacterium]|nr:hypothetical protein [Candidatus Aminicenantes bacterium]
MTAKKLLLLIAVVFALSFLLRAEKRNPPLPLEELQNSKGPSYVPIPYPKTREEIITDVKYIIKKHYARRKNRFSVHAGKRKRRGPELLGLLNKESRLKFGKILKIKSYYTFFPEDYAILVDILDENEQLEARMCFKASGIWTQTSFTGEKTKSILKPFRSKEEAKKFFFNLDPGALGHLEILDMERVIYGYSYISSPISPVWVIKAASGTYYMDTKRYDVYKLKEEISIKTLKSLKNIPDGEKIRKDFIKRCPFSIQDNVNGVVFGLERITKTNLFNLLKSNWVEE